MTTQAKHTVFYALNKHNHTAAILNCWRYWEEVQMAFRYGIEMPDGSMATGIGRCVSVSQFHNRAEFGEWSILQPVHDNA